MSAPQPERRCQCREMGTLRGGPCQCYREMTQEDMLCDPCRWAEKHNGGCRCHIQSVAAHAAATNQAS